MWRVVMSMVLVAAWGLCSAVSTEAGETTVPNIETLFAKKEGLSGQRIKISGKVVKVNNGIMGKNFLHLRDGSGSEGTNDLTVTTQDNPQVGDQVVVIGVVTLNRDFGAGYSYPLIVEEASVTPTGH